MFLSADYSFSGTVRSNILFGAPEASDERLYLAARVSQSAEFIEKLDKSTTHTFHRVDLTFLVDSVSVSQLRAQLQKTRHLHL